MTISNYHESIAVKKTRFSVKDMPSWSITLISVATLMIVWELCGPWINPLFGSYPSQIIRSFLDMMSDGMLVRAFVQSIQPFVVGYALAALAGIPIGLLLGRYRVVDAAFGIYITAGYATPSIALVPLLMVWFGLGFSVKVVIVFLMAFFPICINTTAGVKAVPKTLIEVGTAFCASQTKIMRQIVLPATLPYIMAGLRLAVGKAVIGMILAEFLTALSGLGGIIINAANSFRTAEMFVPIILVMILAVVLEKLLALLEHVVAPWQREISGDGH